MARKWIPTSRNPEEFERQVAAAIERGRIAAETEPRAEAAHFHADTGRVEVHLRDGLSFAFPAARYPKLAALSSERLSEVRVTASGYGLHWDDADVHLAVPQVVADLFGGWSAQVTGRDGGKSQSPAKRAAARKNALRGGRPALQKQARREGEMLHVEAHAGPHSRTVDVYVGGEYVVEPMNPAARKNRGRTGEVVALSNDRYGRVQFRFSDTGRIALVDAHDLLPLQQQSSAA
jgi:Protein of unknown function (DUF2442)